MKRNILLFCAIVLISTMHAPEILAQTLNAPAIKAALTKVFQRQQDGGLMELAEQANTLSTQVSETFGVVALLSPNPEGRKMVDDIVARAKAMAYNTNATTTFNFMQAYYRMGETIELSSLQKNQTRIDESKSELIALYNGLQKDVISKLNNMTLYEFARGTTFSNMINLGKLKARISLAKDLPRPTAKSPTINSNAQNILVERDFGEGNALHWTLRANGMLTITGQGDLPDFDKDAYKNGYQWFQYHKGIKSLTISEGITRIGNRNFYSLELLQISLPSTLREIGYRGLAFNDFVELTLPDSLVNIRESAFFGCKKLKTVKIGNNVMDIEKGAFMKCTALQSINLGKNLKHIGMCAFSGCTALQSVNLGENVQQIDTVAFAQCPNLRAMTLPESVDTIKGGAFYKSGISVLSIPSSVVIESGGLCGMQNLKTLIVDWEQPIKFDENFFAPAGETPTNISNVKLVVPKGQKQIYSIMNGWSNFASIEEVNRIKKDYAEEKKIVNSYLTATPRR